MMRTYYYRVADFPFSLNLDGRMDVETLLPSFRPFRTMGDADDTLLFDFTVVPPDGFSDTGKKDLLEETCNDMGYLKLYAMSGGYMVEVINGCYTHRMVAASDFSSVEAVLMHEDGNLGHALSSLLRIVYAQAILFHNAVSIHASAVYNGGKGYLFMGPSGTGKSTHASLWMRHVPGTELLNDDNPTVRIVDGKAYACGTPWSGKTACYKNLSFPVGGMVRLKQASYNRFCRQEGADAFIAIYPGCSVIAQDRQLRDRLYDTLTRLAGAVTVGTMECLPDEEAAWLCYGRLTKNEN